MRNKRLDWQAKIIIKWYQARGKWHSFKMTFGINKGLLAPIAPATVAIFLYLIEHRFENSEPRYYAYAFYLSWIVAGLAFCYVTYNAVRNYRATAIAYQIISDLDYKRKVLSQIKLSRRQRTNGYELRTFDNGAFKESYLASDAIDSHLISIQSNGQTIPCDTIKPRYSLPDELKQFVPATLRDRLKENRVFFNGSLLKLSSDLFLDSDKVVVQKVGYYDGYCSNGLVFKRVKSNAHLNKIFCGETLLFDSNHELWDLDSSPCANYLGASTLAVTSDGYLIIGKQGAGTMANAGRYAPSGSGSVDYRDHRHETDFIHVLIRAMEREFCEETNYLPTARGQMKTMLLGYARLIEQGGKPDFFGITFLPDEAHTLKKQIKLRERTLQDDSVFVKLVPGAGISKALSDFCKDQPQQAVSIQLHILCELLARYETALPDLTRSLGLPAPI